MNAPNEARTQNALSKKYNFSGEIMTLAEFLQSHKLVLKSSFTRNHEMRRRELEYKPCKTVTEYTVWYQDGEEEHGISIPKLVYDTLELPEKHTDHTY